MKTQIFVTLLFAITLNQIHAYAAPSADTALYAACVSNCNSCDPKSDDPTDIKIVVSQKRIWFVADEMPMKCLKTQVKNATGEIVLEKCFSSKCTDWFLNIEALPKGDYTLLLGADRVEKFKK